MTFIFVPLFTLRERGREREREGEKHHCVVASPTSPYWGPGPQPRHVRWLRIESVTPWFAGWHSIHWATPASAGIKHFDKVFFDQTHCMTCECCFRQMKLNESAANADYFYRLLRATLPWWRRKGLSRQEVCFWFLLHLSVPQFTYPTYGTYLIGFMQG